MHGARPARYRRGMQTTLMDGAAAFVVSVREAAKPTGVVLFAVGRGGDPERHVPLLDAFAARGLAVVAPHFERLPTPYPSDDDLLLRARRLRMALSVAPQDVPVAGVGHSIGATMLLALAGAKLWKSPTGPLPIAPEPRLVRAALLAPAIGFFQAPGALDGVRGTIEAWAGTADELATPTQIEGICAQIGARMHAAEGAGHFSFMHVPPPATVEPLRDRDAFLAALTADLCAFAAGR